MRHEERWQGSAKPWIMPMLVSIIALALCFTSCATCRNRTETEQIQEFSEQKLKQDSVLQELKATVVRPIRMSEVSLRIPVDSLRKLPVDAAYTIKNGQANLKLGRTGYDTIYVYASCDSLQMLVDYYYLKMSGYKEHAEDLHTKLESKEKMVLEQGDNTVLRRLSYTLSGLMTGVVIGFVIALFRKSKKQQLCLKE